MSTALRSRISRLEAQGASNGSVDAIVTLLRSDGTIISRTGSIRDTTRAHPVLNVIFKAVVENGEMA